MTRRLASVPDTARRAGMYVRVSAVMGRAGEDFLSPSIQVDTMRSAADRAGHAIVEVWEDIDVSGRSMTRPGLTEAMAAARDGRIDVLWVYDLSRFARNAAGGLAELAAIEKTGVEVMSATEAVDRSTASGKMTAGVLLLLAEMKSDQIGESWQRVIAANAERGVLHGRAPVGYVRTARRVVEVDPTLGPAMTDAFTLAAAGGSLQAIARDLARLAGRPIMPTTVRQALRSPVYLGLVRHKGGTYPGRHPALTDVETWKQVQVRLEAAAKIPPRTQEARYALAGLAKCGGCGRALWRRLPGSRARGDYLVCRGKRIDGTSTCLGIGVPQMVEVEAKVLDEVRRRLVDVEDETAAQAVRLSQVERQRSDLRSVADELGRTERAISGLTVKFADGVLSDFAYASAVRTLEERAALLREQQQTAETALSDSLTFTESRDLAAALLEAWPALTPKERNAALRTHVERVIVRRGETPREPVEGRVEVILHGGC